MYQKTTVIRNKTGLHMRPATEFVACASTFGSDIKIGCADREERGNAKSVVMLLKLSLSKGTRIEISADGPDEKDAVDTLISLVDSGFNDL